MSVNRFLAHWRKARLSLHKATKPYITKKASDKAMTNAAKHMVRAYLGVPYPFSLTHPQQG